MAELSRSGINLSLDEYILRGMYPRPYKDNINATKFYRDYVQTYIERDVIPIPELISTLSSSAISGAHVHRSTLTPLDACSPSGNLIREMVLDRL